MPTPTTTPDPSLSGLGLSEAEIATLSSLTQVDDHPLYTMHYVGTYDQAAALREDVPAPAATWGCTLFAALGDADARRYGRNFDWRYSPAVLLFTDPPDGYASVSMVDIAYLGFDGEQATELTDLPLAERQALLATPFLPFDGMNEQGLAIGMAAVSPGGMAPDSAKETIDSLGIIREMLDHARDVDEAVALMQRYNINMGTGPPLHYLLADRAGNAALVEFYRGEMVVIPQETDWHLATNFLRASVAAAEGQCWRYDTLQQRLTETQGRLTASQAMDLLAAVAQDNTEWSVVYNISTGEVHVAMDGAYEQVHNFRLND
jgi:hypothetical protein